MKNISTYIGESILSSTGVGIQSQIKQWCDAHNIYNGMYKINTDNSISPSSNYKNLEFILDESDDFKLPEYIRFRGDKEIRLKISYRKEVRNVYVNDFTGFPDTVCSCILFLDNQVLAPLHINVVEEFWLTSSYMRKFEDLKVIFLNDSLSDKKFVLKTYAPLKNAKIIGAKVLNFVNDSNIGDKFSKAMHGKAPMNKHRTRYTDPAPDGVVEDVCLNVIPEIEPSQLSAIFYTQNSMVRKVNGRWYRCKNW